MNGNEADTEQPMPEVAKFLSCSLSNVYALADKGERDVVAIGACGKGYRVTQAALTEFLNRC